MIKHLIDIFYFVPMLTQQQTKIALFIFAIFLFLSYTIPIHDHPYRTYYNEALGVLGVVASMSYWASTSKVTIRIPYAVLLSFGLIAVIGVQTANGFILYPVDMFFPVLFLLSFALAMVYGATMASQEKGLMTLMETFANTFLVIGLVSVFIQFVQVINLNWTPFIMPLSWVDAPRPYANLAQPNMLALLFSFSVASVWYLYIEAKIKPWTAIFLLMFLLWGLALAQSRIAWIILPLYFLLCWKQVINTPKISKLVLIVLLLSYVWFVFFVPHFMHWLGISVYSLQEHATQTADRIVMWQEALAISLNRPWFGVGWYQFGVAQALISTLFSPDVYSNYAHNIVLNFAAEIGWPLTILIFGSALVWFYQCCVCRWNNLQIRFISLMMLAIAVHSMVEFPLWYGFVLMPFGVMIGAAHTEKLKWEHVVVARGWIIAFMLTCMISVAAMTWDYDRVVKGFTALAWQQEGKKSGIGSIEKPEFTLYPQFYDYFHIIKINLDANMPKSDLEFLERVALRFSFQPVLSRLAIAYVNNHRPNDALQVLLIIHRLHNDLYPSTYAEWANLARKNPELCGEIFKRLPKPIVKEMPKSVVVMPNVTSASSTAQ